MPEQGVGVTCFVATCDENPRDAVAAAVAAELDPSCKLPARQGQPPQLVVGTLDLNIGEADGRARGNVEGAISPDPNGPLALVPAGHGDAQATAVIPGNRDRKDQARASIEGE